MRVIIKCKEIIDKYIDYYAPKRRNQQPVGQPEIFIPEQVSELFFPQDSIKKITAYARNQHVTKNIGVSIVFPKTLKKEHVHQSKAEETD